MARQVLPIVGAAVGFFIGGPMGAQLGYMAGSVIGNAVDPLEIQGNKVGDNPLQTAAEGGARAIVFGRGCVRATCLIDRGNRQVRKQRDQAGKGGGPVTVNERVYWTFAVGLGEDLIGGAILRVWEGEKLVYDVTPESAIPEESAEFAQKFRFYDGAEDQLPDPALEAIHGIGNTPYYRGTAYVVFPNFDLTDYRESIPVYRWEVAKSAEVNQFAQLYTDELPDGATVMEWSPNGDYLAVGHYDFSGESLAIYKRNGDTFTKLPPVAEMPAGRPQGLSWTSDSKYLGVAAEVGNGVCVYARVGDTFAKGEVDGHPDWQERGLSWFGDTLLVVPFSGDVTFSIPPRLAYWTRSGADITLVDEFVELAAYPSGMDAADNNGTRLTVGLETSPYIEHFTRSGDTFLSVGALGITPDGEIISPKYTQDGNFLFAACDAADTFVGWEWNGSSFDALTVPDGNTTPNGIAISSTNLIATTGASPSCIVFRNLDGVVTQVASFTAPGGATRCAAWSPNSIYLAVAGTDLTIYKAETLAEKVILSDIVSNLHGRAGHVPSQYDTTELTDLLSGVVFEQSMTYGEAINQVIGPYMADPSDYDKAIHYLKRGKPVVKTLTIDDLIDEPEQSMRENAIEYPKKIHLFFQSPITAYAATKATSVRSSPDVRVIGEASIALPITFDDADEPAQISAKLHKVYWQDAEGEIEWHVTDEHIDLVPGDCVGLSLRGIVRRARITRIEDNPGERKLVMRSDRQSAYTSNVTGIPLPPPTPPRPSIIAPTILAIIDEAALTDSADDLHYVAAMSGATDVWGGAALQRSLDDGANYLTAGAASLNAIMGTLQNTVGAASPHYTDTTNTVQVQLYTDDELESRSTVAWLSEQGAFALSWEDSGGRRFEFLQARDVTDLGDGLYELSHLMRGVLNTDAAEHVPGALFVWLDAALVKVAAQTAWLDTGLTHRAVSNGLSPETATPQTEEYEGRSQREWPVGGITLERDGDDILIAINPRHRFGTDVNPIRSVNWDGYSLEVTDGSSLSAFTITSDTYTFDATGMSSPIQVAVAQRNRLTGIGPYVSEEIA